MASDKETDDAITAVRNGQGDRRQEELAARAAKTMGERGRRARDAFKGK